MTRRAFIIAIENYRQMQEGLSPTLPDTHGHALEFRDWLIGTQKLAPADICFCTEDPTLSGRTADATRPAIKQELRRFKDLAKDATGDVYFYFSGHGFCYLDIDDVPTADVILAADYVRREDSGDACFKLDEIQKWLKMCLGSVTDADGRCGHYYFIDACRNMVTEREIKVAPLGFPYDISARKKAPVFTLYSTTTGAVANVANGFPEALLDGLRGKGQAKRWYEGTFAVLFDSLRKYLEDRLDTESRTEGGDGVIRTLGADLESTCAVTVKNATAHDEFRVEVSNDRRQVIQTFTFAGPARQFKAAPDEYSVHVALTTPAGAVVEPAIQPADLYDDCALSYEKRVVTPPGPFELWRGETAPPAPVEPVTASLNVIAPQNAEVTIRGGKDRVFTATGAPEAGLTPGNYRVEIRDARGVTVDRRDVKLEAGDHALDLTTMPASPLQMALLGAIPGNHGGGAYDFSESLGPIPDQGLDLWLALIGAARIIGGPDDFSKLSPLPLKTFDHLGPDDRMIYLLAGFEQPAVMFRAVFSDDWRARPVPVAPHPYFPGLFELVDMAEPGGHRYLTVQVDDNAPITVGACALTKRGSLVTLTQDAQKPLQIQQFILPLKQFQEQLPERGGLWLGGPEPGLDEMSAPLGLVRRCVEVQRAFARAEDLEALLTPKALEFLLYFKWFEPIVALLAAYELVRRGNTELLPVVVDNFRAHFGNLPDADALARLAGRSWQMPARPPLVLEGLQALDLMSGSPGVPPADALAFRGPWSMWRGVAQY